MSGLSPRLYIVRQSAGVLNLQIPGASPGSDRKARPDVEVGEDSRRTLPGILHKLIRGAVRDFSERREAEGLVNLADLLSLLRLRAEPVRGRHPPCVNDQPDRGFAIRYNITFGRAEWETSSASYSPLQPMIEKVKSLVDIVCQRTSRIVFPPVLSRKPKRTNSHHSVQA